MRLNLPITETEYSLPEDAMLVSVTDTKGHITFANEAFIEASGFSEQELLGKAHNIVRHPDMPEEAFADLWSTLKSGRPWTALVKNRRKNGDFYWVLANVTPVRSGKNVTGFMSVRSKPTREQIQAAADVYGRIKSKRADGLAIREGKVVQRGVLDRLRFFRHLTLAQQALVMAGCFAIPALVTLGALGFLSSGAATHGMAYALIGVCAVGLAAWHVLSAARISRTLHQMANQIDELTEGRFDHIFDAVGSDALARTQRSLQSLRTKVGFELADARRVAVDSTRVRKALDTAAASVMVADPAGQVIYANHSLVQMMSMAERDIRSVIPGFSSQALLGSNIDQFRQGGHSGNGFEAGNDGSRKRLKLGERQIDVVINPIVESNGKRLGTVVEWCDRTQELSMQQELEDMLRAILDGDLTPRIRLESKTGYFESTSRAVNELANNMAEMIGKTKLLVGEVARSAQEISGGNTSLAQRTEEQSASLEETAASMEEMTGTVKQNADNAREADALARATRQRAESSSGVVGSAVTAMAGIHEASSKIASIIGVIDSIAFQTNLLALNAAVEAARAGEQGRGFAVVASEVRNLAGRSASAAREIKDLIGDSVAKVERGSELVGRSGESLSEIVTSVQKVSTIVSDIAAASAEQSTGIEQVNRAVMQMDQLTQQNAALVEEVATASASMVEQAADLRRLMERYRLAEAAPQMRRDQRVVQMSAARG